MNKAILIVDNDELVRDLLTTRLTHMGFTAHAVPHGEAALARLEQTPADLVIMDTLMPMLSGAETLVRIRANPALSHIPVLILSQKAAASERQMVMALGAAGFMAKPFCCHELVDLVEQLLASSRKQLLKRLKVTVLGSAALTAAIPAAAQAAAPLVLPPIASVPANAASEAAKPLVTPQTSMTAPLADPQSALDQPAPLLESVPPAANEEAWQTRHALTLVQGRGWISGGSNVTWNDTTLAYGFRPTKRSGYAFEVERAERFGLVDTQLSARGDWQIGPRTSVYVSVNVTPSADFREKRGLRAGISHTVMPHVEIGASTRLGAFADGPKLALTPYIAFSTKGETVTFFAEQINLWNLEGPADYRAGYAFRLRGQPTGRLRTLAGFARYPEVELGVARNVRSIYGGLSYDVSDSIGVSANYASDRYESLFTRNGATIGLTYRWRGSG
jgi:YaiO family outer membrane protein